MNVALGLLAGAVFVFLVALCLPFEVIEVLTRDGARRRMELAAELEAAGRAPHPERIAPDAPSSEVLDFILWKRELHAPPSADE